MRRFFRVKVLEPIKAQLAQGVTPARLALALALGLVIGSIPVLGVSALICAVVAWLLRLNQPAIQVANYLAYPLQLALFVPFFEAGAEFFEAPKLQVSIAQLQAELAADVSGTMGRYAMANVHALGAWAAIAPLAVGVVFAALWWVLARAPLRRAVAPPSRTDAGELTDERP